MKNKTNAVQVIARATRCPDFEPDEIFSLMRRLNMNEKGLAILINVTPATVRLWTSGAVKPCGTAKRIMQIYSACPEVISRISVETEEPNAEADT